MRLAPAPAYSGFTFNGRIARKPYWWGLLVSAGLSNFHGEAQGWPWAQLAIGLQIIVVGYQACLSARRLHDIGLSAWWRSPLLAAQIFLFSTLLLIPGELLARFLTSLGAPRLLGFAILGLGGALLLFDGVIGLIPGRKEANRYGPAPIPGPVLGQIFR